jgi:hypothetical protein
LELKDRIQFATGSQTKVEVQWDRIHTMVFLELETRLVHRQLKILRLELRYQNEMQVDSCAAIIVIILYFVLNVISTDANKTEQKVKKSAACNRRCDIQFINSMSFKVVCN